MTALPRTLDEAQHALIEAERRVERLESVNSRLQDELADARAEHDAAFAEQARLEDRVRILERAVEGVRDAVKGL